MLLGSGLSLAYRVCLQQRCRRPIRKGLVPLGDVRRATGMTIPPEVAANTLSGLFMLRLKRMPETGDRLAEDGFRLTVKRLDERHVAAVEIRAAPPPLNETAAPTGS